MESEHTFGDWVVVQYDEHGVPTGSDQIPEDFTMVEMWRRANFGRWVKAVGVSRRVDGSATMWNADVTFDAQPPLTILTPSREGGVVWRTIEKEEQTDD